MEVYINDILVKSERKEDHIEHLREAFGKLRQYDMKLNPEKCAFGVASGKFSGFLVSQRGIEVNPDKIKAIDGKPEHLTTKKQVKKLIGRIVALSRFISRSSDRCHKFFSVLKKENNLQWTPECIQALKKLKVYLSSPPLLSKSEPGQPFLVYLAVSEVVDGILPNDKKEAKKRRMTAARYNIVHNDLYKKTYGGPLEKCLGPNQMRRILEVHKGHYGAHYGNRALVSYNNEPQFAGKKVADLFEKWHIKRILSTPYHSAGNGKAESSYKSILNIIKKKLEDAKGLWLEILPEVIWAYRTMPKTSTGEMPYSFVYWTDAVIPVEVGELSLRYFRERGPQNDDNGRQELDEVGEQRDMAYVRMVSQKQQAERYYNKRAKISSTNKGTR
nr:uncharacterized protein LOC117279300 [Nicotiana tomentosiformis]